MHTDHERVLAIIAADPWAIEMLRHVRELNLPDWVIGAGFLRSLVWDRLCGFTTRTPLNDIDTVFYDPADISRERENAAEAQLTAWCPEQVWSVRNMARMHVKNREAPYSSTEDAIGHWLETPTAVGIGLAVNDRLYLQAPHGVNDLLAGRVRPTPNGQRKIEEYRARVAGKDWAARWPRIQIEGLT